MVTIAVAGFVVGVGQLIVGILALRTKSASSNGHASRLASDRDALNALLIAATCTTVAAMALARVQVANNEYRSAIESLARGDVAVTAQTMSPMVSQILIGIGVVSATGALIYAQRAWRRWSGPSAEARGVALAALLAVAAGALAINLIASLTIR